MTKNLKALIHRLTGVLCLCGMLFSAGIFASCTENKDEVEEFANWKSTNDTYWQKLYTATEQKIKAGDTSWKLILNYTLQGQQANSGATLSYRPEDYIIVHVEETGTGTVTPIYSDSVAVHYKGQLIPSTTYTAGLIFDKSWSRMSLMLPLHVLHIYRSGVLLMVLRQLYSRCTRVIIGLSISLISWVMAVVRLVLFQLIQLLSLICVWLVSHMLDRS